VTNILSQSNRLFTLVRQSQRQPSVLEAVAVVVVNLALMIAAQAGGRKFLATIFPGNGQGLIVEGACGFLAVYLGLLLWLRLRSNRPFWTLGFQNYRLGRSVLGGAVTAGLMMGAAVGLDILPGASLSPGEIRTTGIAALAIAFLSLVSHILHASAEETLFRGLLLPVIGSRYGAFNGVLVSAFLFSLAHATNVAGHPNVALVALLNLFMFGIFAAVYALAEGGLWGTCAWHAVWNWAEGDLLGLPLDGGVHSGLLVSIRPNGADIFTGGTFGPEGGLAVTGILVAGILFLFNMQERTK
jgi:membrane protease YdiL (CAAX protease family)